MRDLSIEGSPSVTAIVDALAFGEARLTRRQLADLVGQIGRQDNLWRPIVRHDFDHRWYIRLHWSRSVEVWLLGWQPGQDTQVHDHGGSSGAFVVTEGTLTERYGSVERWAGGRRRHHLRGRACWFGPDYAHNLGNAGPGVATSVHAYSPPLSTMTYYRADVPVLVPRQTVFTSGPEPGIDLALATGADGYASPVPGPHERVGAVLVDH
ncbi:MAG: cysteine dioxygenase family protein [Actinomycetota bacterium]|nr:cysteine dioxygenase family protein [Actinomycetota bacterium]